MMRIRSEVLVFCLCLTLSTTFSLSASASLTVDLQEGENTVILQVKNIGCAQITSLRTTAAEEIPQWLEIEAPRLVDMPLGTEAELPVLLSVEWMPDTPSEYNLHMELRDRMGNRWPVHIALSLPDPPEKTRFLGNYPNPFNPETWIPYELAEAAEVEIRVYDIKGSLVKTLDLGYKQQGFYTTKDKAAYWDGRNEVGEEVTSGVYFCQLQAGKFAAIRKMVVVR